MDLDSADAAADNSAHDSSVLRRGLIGAGIAGVVAAAAAASGADAAPNTPTDADREAMEAAMRLELAAAALYNLAAGQVGGDEGEFVAVVAENHEAYANSIAGAIGVSAQGRNEEVYGALESAFDTSDAQAMASAARDLENTAVATHTELLGGYESIDAVELTASILVVEARQAVVFTSMAGFAANLDEMLNPASTPLGGAA